MAKQPIANVYVSLVNMLTSTRKQLTTLSLTILCMLTYMKKMQALTFFFII